MTTKKTAILLATMIGTMFSASSFADSATTNTNEASVKCTGVNACKGNSACKTATNACKGQNSCKGQGIVMTQTEKECTDQGGKVEKS